MEGKIEYWANNKIDVMRSLTDIVASNDGMKASKRGSGLVAKRRRNPACHKQEYSGGKNQTTFLQ